VTVKLSVIEIIIRIHGTMRGPTVADRSNTVHATAGKKGRTRTNQKLKYLAVTNIKQKCLKRITCAGFALVFTCVSYADKRPVRAPGAVVFC